MELPPPPTILGTCTPRPCIPDCLQLKEKTIQINSYTKNISAAGMILIEHFHVYIFFFGLLKLIEIANRNFSDFSDRARKIHREIAIVEITKLTRPVYSFIAAYNGLEG